MISLVVQFHWQPWFSGAPYLKVAAFSCLCWWCRSNSSRCDSEFVELSSCGLPSPPILRLTIPTRPPNPQTVSVRAHLVTKLCSTHPLAPPVALRILVASEKNKLQWLQLEIAPLGRQCTAAMSPSVLFMLWVSDVSAGEGASVALLPRASNILPPFLSSARHTHTDKHTHRQTHTHTHTQTHVQCIALWAAAQLERDTFLREPARALDAGTCACLCLTRPPPVPACPLIWCFFREPVRVHLMIGQVWRVVPKCFDFMSAMHIWQRSKKQSTHNAKENYITRELILNLFWRWNNQASLMLKLKKNGRNCQNIEKQECRWTWLVWKVLTCCLCQHRAVSQDVERP